MEKEVDVITLCKKLTEKTAQEMCAWKETSLISLLRFTASTAPLTISDGALSPPIASRATIVNSLIRNPFHATYKSIETQSDYFKAFKSLYQSIRAFLERIRRRKIALLYEEINESDATS